MTLHLVRQPRGAVTMGSLSVNGVWQCYTLEDQLREVAGQPVSDWKVPKATAIPAGRYRVVLTMSQRFGRLLPLLIDVPGFTGVRIHAGNTQADTDGCILVGYGRVADTIVRSRMAEHELVLRLDAATDDVWIEIEPTPILTVQAASRMET